jgi:uncharacterized protein YecE (DUF72 family)
VLGEAGESMEKFLGQGLTELGSHLGAILWQFMPTKQFVPDDFAAFLDLLPDSRDGIALGHCVEVRHASFADPAFVELCRRRGVAICCSENANYPLIADVTGDFVYARLLTGSDTIETAYPPEELDAWAGRFTAYARGDTPADLASVSPPAPVRDRDVFAFFIHEGKVRAPAAAAALLSRV